MKKPAYLREQTWQVLLRFARSKDGWPLRDVIKHPGKALFEATKLSDPGILEKTVITDPRWNIYSMKTATGGIVHGDQFVKVFVAQP